MIPILYEKTETAFTSNGICRLSDCISCTVHEERNGEYECEFQYPVSGAHFSDIYEGRIIACTHDETGDVQPFDIYAHTAPIDGVVTFNAHHISYRQSGITVKPFTASGIAAAIAAIKSNSVNTNDFTYWTNKSTAGDFAVTEPRPARALLCGEEGSLLDVFGSGEYEFDKFTVKLHSARGSASGVSIRYGKNLVDFEEQTDYSDSYTGIVPYWIGTDSNDQEVLVNVTNWVVRSGQTSYGSRDIIIPVDMTDKFDSQPTAAQLQTAAENDLSAGQYWLPTQTIKVDFVQLWQTEEYKQFAPLQRVKLCDTVSVYYPALDVTIPTVKVIETTYNVLLERYDEMVLGDAQKTFAAMITESVNVDLSGYAKLTDLAGVEGEIQTAVNTATQLITGGSGGYVYIKPDANGKPQEILIMNTADINTATKVWRWNVNGLGYSSTGYSGTYGTAITMNGAIVADFITTGTLTANLIKAGVISDASNKNSWNMTSGAMTLRDATFYGNNDQMITQIGDTLYMRNEDTSTDVAMIHLRDADVGGGGTTIYKHARLWADRLTFTASDNSMASLIYSGSQTFQVTKNIEADGYLKGANVYATNKIGGQSGAAATLQYTTIDNTCNISALVDSALSASSTNPVQNKAINTALQSKADASLVNGLAPLASPALTGTPTAPTAASGTNTTQIATTAFVQAALSGLSGYAPTDHKSTATTYGVGDGQNYGHLKLSDSTSNTSSVSGGVAATPYAVKAAVTAANNYTDDKLNGVGTIYSATITTGSVASGTTYKDITDEMVLPAGRYVLFGKADFNAQATASSRAISIYNVTDSTGLDDALVRVNVTSQGGHIHLSTSTCLAFSASKSFKLRAMQNSGQSVSVTGYLKAIKIANY